MRTDPPGPAGCVNTAVTCHHPRCPCSRPPTSWRCDRSRLRTGRCSLAGRLRARLQLAGAAHGPQRAVGVQFAGLRLRHHAVPARRRPELRRILGREMGWRSPPPCGPWQRRPRPTAASRRRVRGAATPPRPRVQARSGQAGTDTASAAVAPSMAGLRRYRYGSNAWAFVTLVARFAPTG